MNTAAPLFGDEIGIDLRDAARRAAREEGKSVAEWLQALMEDRAGALGVSADDLDADDRLRALTQGLAEVSAHRSPATALGDATSNGEAERRRTFSAQGAARWPGPPLERTLSERVAMDWEEAPAAVAHKRRRGDVDLAARQEEIKPADLASARQWAESTDWDPAPAAAPEPAQCSTIEAKLNTLFSALNKSSGRETVPRRDPPPVIERTDDLKVAAAPAVDRPTTVRTNTDLLGNTALGSKRTLDQAIAEIAERQAKLNRAPPPRQERIAASKNAAAPQAPGPVAAKAGQGASVGGDESPALFASLKGDIARMSQRLEAMHTDVAQRSVPAQAKDATFHEIRSLLDRMRPDQSIDALERRVGDLTSKIDKALESHVAPDAFENLSQRLEHVHDALTDRLSSRGALDVDTGSLEQAVRDIVGSVGSARDGLPDVKALEALMQRLSDRLDEPRDAQGEVSLLADLQIQVGKLAERIDKSDAGLAAIVSVERSLGELFSQMEETRDAAINAAENAARTAARDTLRSAMTESSLPFGQAQRQADAAVEQVTQEIAELKTARDAADKRLHGILNALNATLEKVIDRLGALEDGAQARTPSVPDLTRSPAAAPLATAPAPAVANPLNAAFRARPVAQPEPAVPISAPRRPAERSAPIDDDDFLIEPGVARARDSEAAPPAGTPPQPTPAVQPDPANFIAAARRAAQAAAQSAQEAATRTTSAAAGKTSATGAAPAGAAQSLKARAASFLTSRRRPLLLALAGIVILIGAVQVARLSLQRADGVAVSGGPEAAKPVETAANAPAVLPVKSVAPEASAADADAPHTTGTIASTVASADAAKPPAPASPPSKPLPTLAMGPAANLAAQQVSGGIGLGLRNMAEDGNAAAQYEVALRLADGRGVARDVKTAAEWFEKAAKLGLAPAAYRLGSLYEKGLGVTRDPATAVQWYEKAADAGNIRAMHNLAVMSAEGANGKSDYVKAASWFSKAAQAGVRDSQFNLAILYARGLGIEQSLSQSYMWFAVAAAQGDADSATKRDDVAQRLDPKALADAKKSAAEFRPLPTITAANDVTPPPGGWDAVAPRSTVSPTSTLKTNIGARLSSM